MDTIFSCLFAHPTSHTNTHTHSFAPPPPSSSGEISLKLDGPCPLCPLCICPALSVGLGDYTAPLGNTHNLYPMQGVVQDGCETLSATLSTLIYQHLACGICWLHVFIHASCTHNILERTHRPGKGMRCGVCSILCGATDPKTSQDFGVHCARLVWWCTPPTPCVLHVCAFLATSTLTWMVVVPD